MKKLVVSVPIAAVALGLVFASTASVIANGVVHSVHVGGPDLCEALNLPLGCDMNFSLTANEFSDGSVNGRWTDIINNGPGTTPLNIIVAVDCLHVVGNAAWVAGEIVGPDLAELRVGTRVVDIGVSANDMPDGISFTNVFSGDCHDAPSFPLFRYFQGQVTIR